MRALVGSAPGLGFWRRRVADQALQPSRAYRAHPGDRARSKGHPESLIRTGKLAANLGTRVVHCRGQAGAPDRQGYPLIVAATLQKSAFPERAEAVSAY